MSYSFKWSIGAEVDGESVGYTGTVDATGRDHVRVTIPSAVSPATPTPTSVEIQPGTDRVSLLVVTASEYGTGLTYQVDGGTATIALDAPQIFVGEGSLGLLDAVPRTLVFTNGLTTDVTVTVLVGRNAVV